MTNIPPWGFTKLAGSERTLPTNARKLQSVDEQESIEVSVYLRDPAASSLTASLEGSARQPGPRLSREEYVERHSATAEDIAQVEHFAHHHHLNVVAIDPLVRKIVLSGTAGHLATAFGTELHHYEHQGRLFRGRSGYLHVPNELEPVITGVFGLDNRPQAHTQVRFAAANDAATSYTPPQLAQLYNYPTSLDGTGECVAIIELGGGYNDQDLTTYFQQLGIAKPRVISVSVDGTQNTPAGDPNSADGEVALDIEVVGGIAPGALIAVYFAPNTDRGFLDAITQATHDTTNKPSVISISWGGPESSWTDQAMTTMDQAIQAAVALGITVCVAAGDNGSSDGVTDQKVHVDFPASSTYALGCGGTRLEGANNQISSEVVWDEVASNEGATGGGVSEFFALPTWQSNAQVPPSASTQHVGRGVPDVAGDADPSTGYQVYVDGQSAPIGGTSAVAPLWAGLIALLNQKRGTAVGYLNPFLYQNYTQLQNNGLRDITSGNNGSYTAGPGWDACTGLGSPNGAQLLQALLNTPPTQS
jgi:kumamolisin